MRNQSPNKKRAPNRNYCEARIVMFVQSIGMKAPVIALLTNDHNLEECVAQVLLRTGGLSHRAQSANDVLDLVCTIGQNLDLVVIDCEEEPDGLTLLDAISTRRRGFPVIVITGPGEEDMEALVYANGAAVCLSKPVSAPQLAEAMKQCHCSQPHLIHVD
jgi:DNA-binding NtrC family response regulator